MNSFGKIFGYRFLVNPDGQAIGVVLDVFLPDASCGRGFSCRIWLAKERAPGTTRGTEPDRPRLISGIYNGYTTGAPLTILFENKDIRSTDYALFTDIPRPGHADFTARTKFKGFNDPRGGGHFSGRMTLALVAAGVVAKKMIPAIKIKAEILEIDGDADIQRCLKRWKRVVILLEESYHALLPVSRQAGANHFSTVWNR
jgi:chorismate synthase